MADDKKVDLSASLEPVGRLAAKVASQWRMALQHRSTERIGGQSLKTLMRDCYEAKDGGLTSHERQAVMEAGDEDSENFQDDAWANMPISLVDFKVNILISMVRESLIDTADAPFIIDPTPVPGISRSARKKIVDKSQQMILQRAADMNMQGQQITGAEVLEIIRKVKETEPLRERELAKLEASKMERYMYDRTTEGGYKNALIEFTDDFCTYPFGVLHGPVPTMSKISKWDKDKFVQEEMITYRYLRVSPFDFFWTPDSKDAQSGTAVFIRKRLSLEYLYQCRNVALSEETKDEDDDFESENGAALSGYVLENIMEVLEMGKAGRVPATWSEFDAANPEDARKVITRWSDGDTVEVLTRYGRFQGSELIDHGFKGLKEYESYETVINYVAGRIIQIYINDNPGESPRPVHTSSFQNRNGSIAGVGLAQKLLPLQRAYRACLKLAMLNLGLSAEPITELDAKRVMEYLPDEFPGKVFPGMTLMVGPDLSRSNSKAVNIYEIPNIATQALSVANYIKEEAHQISNIPAALHGQPVGSGANRTVRGLLTLQGNVLKPIQTAMINLDVKIIEPMTQLLYMLLLKYDNDFEYIGDVKITAKGAASMVQREVKRQQAVEAIQLLGQFGDKINPQLIERAIRIMLDEDLLDPSEELFMPEAVAAPQPQQAAGGQPGISGTGGDMPPSAVTAPALPG